MNYLWQFSDVCVCVFEYISKYEVAAVLESEQLLSNEDVWN